MSYAVSFEITHSFRSLPLFNLISFEYLKSVLPHDITLEHIYYGNWTQGHSDAPICDCAMIGQVLDMTHAVQEFKNTGRPVSLARLLKEKDSSFSDALEFFDWATQANDFRRIDKSVSKLLMMSRTEGGNDTYSDVRPMVAEVLRIYLLMAPGDTKDLAAYWRQIDADVMTRGNKYLHLCNWHIRMDRHSLASVIAQEAVRSLLVPLTLEPGVQPSETNCANRDARESAENLLRDYVRPAGDQTA